MRSRPGGFRSIEVCRITGLSERQLQWWDETGLVSPQRRGCRDREYSARDLQRLSVLAQMRAKGITLQRARRLMAVAREKDLNCAWIAAASNGPIAIIASDSALDLIREIERWPHAAIVIETFASAVAEAERDNSPAIAPQLAHD